MFWSKKRRKTDEELRKSIVAKTATVVPRGKSTFTIDDPNETSDTIPWVDMSGRDIAQFKRQR